MRSIVCVGGQRMNSHMYVVDRANTVRMQVEDQKGDEYRSWREVTIWIDSGFSEQETIFKSTFKTNWSDKFLRMVLPTLGRILSRLVVVKEGPIMPCNGPSREEVREANLHGELYQLVLDVAAMAGQDGWSLFDTSFIMYCRDMLASSKQAYAWQQHFDRATAELCSVVGAMLEDQRDRYLWDGRNPVAARLAVWWHNHQELDRVRLERESEEERSNRAQAAADAAYAVIMEGGE